MGKQKKKSSVESNKNASAQLAKDPIAPVIWIPPPVALGTKLLEAVEYKPLEEKDLYGMKISLRALKNLSPSEIRNLVDVFQAFDRDSLGVLKAQELFYAIKVLGFNTTLKTCEDYIKIENGESNLKGLNLNQFLDLIIDKQADSKDDYEELVNGFKMFDQDGSGLIGVDNLRRACQDSGIFISETELKEMIIEADQNGDGLVDINEFIGVMLKTNLYGY